MQLRLEEVFEVTAAMSRSWSFVVIVVAACSALDFGPFVYFFQDEALSIRINVLSNDAIDCGTCCFAGRRTRECDVCVFFFKE